jgi:5-methylcytosine-specific restriction endonuclease McrA
MTKRKSTDPVYKRALFVLGVDDVLPLVPTEPLPKDDPRRKHDFGGYVVNVNSVRLRTFALHGITCVKCGARGTSFYVERHWRATGPYHLSLYAIDPVHGEILMTHDHIVPRCKGGADHTSNTQTMCARCNSEKSKGEQP